MLYDHLLLLNGLLELFSFHRHYVQLFRTLTLDHRSKEYRYSMFVQKQILHLLPLGCSIDHRDK